jgi:hypothetical protein
MFRFHWIREIFRRPAQPKQRRPKRTVKLGLESLTDRILPSASPLTPLPVVSVASPPASPITAVTSQMVSAMDQLIVTLQNDVSGARQVIAQEAAFVHQQLDHLFGITPAMPQAGSGSGSGGGAMTTATSAQNQQSKIVTPQSGSGSGSSAATTVHENASMQRVMPLAGSGSLGSGSATIHGTVWLDNNGDGSIDEGEQGLQGVTVNLVDPLTGLGVAQATTDADGDYTIGGAPPGQYEIQVVFPNFEPTIKGSDSQIDANGFSPVFTAPAGVGVIAPKAGLRSTVVTTGQDDPNGIIPNKVTLRDAISTVINGLNQPVTFAASGVGTVSLQAALPDLSTNITIIGNNNTVQGNATANNPYSVFTVNGNITAEIDNLIITGGNAQTGGGIENNGGSLTLNNDVITANTASGSGGGIFNANGSSLYLTNNDLIQYNTASLGGGIANVGGTVTVTASGNPTTILGNNATFQGGGIYNAGGGTVQLQNTVYINGNYAATNGGGVFNSSDEFTMSGGSISANYVIATNGFGGGLYNDGGATLFSVTVNEGNEANKGAGMYLANGSSTDLTSVTVQGNQFIGNNGQGLGIYVQGNGQLTMGEGVNDVDDAPNGPVYGN